MSLLKNLFGRREEILSQEELEQLDDQEEEIKNPHTIEELIASLKNQDEINRIRNFLDKRERELTGNFNLHKPKEDNFKEEIQIDNYKEEIIEPPKELLEEPKNPISSINEIKKSYTAKESIEKEEEKEIQFNQKKENIQIEEPEFEDEYLENTLPKTKIDTSELEKEEIDTDFLEIEEKEILINTDSFEIESDLFYQKISEIFGKHNCSKQVMYGKFLTGIGKKDILQIGVFKSESFTEDINIDEQSSWFISQIKQLEELKNFKILNSKEGIKDLIWDKDKNHAIIISFKVTQFLNENKFDFSL